MGRLQTAVLPVHDFAPWLYDAVASVLMERVELHGTEAVHLGTVFDAPEAAGPTTGGWRSDPLRIALAAAVAALAALVIAVRRR